jgi:hypothetical protein
MFSEWAPRYRAFSHLPTLYIVHFLLLTPPVYQKNDGGVEMMTMTATTIMSEKFWTEAEAETDSRFRGWSISPVTMAFIN